jgi:sulfur carrier protein
MSDPEGAIGLAVIVNGAPRQLASDRLHDLLAQAGLPAGRGVAVAINGEVVPRAAWAERRLAEGDQVEIVRLMVGG